MMIVALLSNATASLVNASSFVRAGHALPGQDAQQRIIKSIALVLHLFKEMDSSTALKVWQQQ